MSGNTCNPAFTRTIPPMLDPETFKLEPRNIRWRFHTIDRLGQFDIAVPANEDLDPDPAALAHLETALTHIDALYDTALTEAERGWQARYNAPLRDRTAWSVVRLFAHPSGDLLLTLHEADFDTYCVWDVTLANGQPVHVEQRPYTAG